MAGSTLLATGMPHVLSAETGPSSTRPYAELRSLPAGAIKPEGWLKIHMEGQSRLAGCAS